MKYPLEVKRLHIELTDRCQAACPMCLRNFNGGADREFIKNIDISLEEFKQWFPIEFIKNLDNMFAAGTVGDPAIAKDCLEIFDYVRQHNPNASLVIHTNGSLRTKDWWKRLAPALGSNGQVVFAIDGFKGEHEIYRRGTSWDKIIENAKEFISAGGRAVADCIVFKHNEDRIEELKEYLLSIGFEYVNLKTTNRFYGDGTFPVKDRNGNHEYTIYPPTNSKWQQKMLNPNIKELVRMEKFNSLLEHAQVEPYCEIKKEIYVDARGNVFPCCWTASIIAEDTAEVAPEMRIIRDRLNNSMKDLISDIGLINLHGTDIITELNKSGWDKSLPAHWQNPKTFVCVKTCASNLKSLVE